MTDGITDNVHVHNHGSDPMASVMAAMGHKHDGGGFMGAGGLLGGLLIGALLGKGGRGLLGGGDSDGGGETRIQDTIFNTQAMAKLGAIEASIPYNEAQVQLALNAVQNALQGQATTNFNATTLATSGVKDAIQTSALLAQGNANQILQAIAASTNTIISKIDGNTIANLQAELSEARHTGRAREVEVNVSQNVNQQQAQVQAQAQFGNIANRLDCLVAEHQRVQQGIVNLGTMVGNTQSAANTRVN